MIFLKFILFISSVCLSFQFTYCQNIDSLKDITKNTAIHDSLKIQAYISLSEYYYSSNLDSMQTFCQTGLNLISKRNNSEKFASEKSDLLNNLGMAYYRKSDFDEAIKSWYEALTLKKELNELQAQADILNNIANIQLDLNELEKGENTFQKILVIQQSINDSIGIARTYNALGYTARLQNNDSLALTFYKMGLRILEDINSKVGIGFTSNNIGFIYKKNKFYKKAIVEYEKSMEIFREIDDKKGLAAVYSNLANCYFELLNYNKAKKMAISGFEIAEKLNAKEDLLYLYDVLYKIERKLNNFEKALEYQLSYTALKDSIDSEKNYKSLVNQELNYKYEQQEKIKDLEHKKAQQLKEFNHINDLKIAEEKSLRFKSILLLSLVGFAIVLVLLYFIYKQLYLLRKQKEIIENQKKEIELKALRLQMNPHFLFNSLNSIKHFVVNNQADTGGFYLTKFAQLMRQVLENTEQDEISLKEELLCLENYLALEKLRNDKHFNYKITESKQSEIVNIPPMLLQPFVENAVIHGILNSEKNERLLEIKIKDQKNCVIIEIIDDGIGRSAAKKIVAKRHSQNKSMGLVLSNSRLNQQKGYSNNKQSIKIIDLYDGKNNAIGTKVRVTLSYD